MKQISPGAREAVLSRWPILVLTSLVLLWVAARLFDIGPMERSGELLMFPGLAMVLRIGVTACTMLLFGSVIIDYHEGMTPLIVIRYVIGYLVGWFMTHVTIAWSQAGGDVLAWGPPRPEYCPHRPTAPTYFTRSLHGLCSPCIPVGAGTMADTPGWVG